MSKCKITGKTLGIRLGRDETQIVLTGKGAEVLYTLSLETPAGAVEDGMILNQDAVRTMLRDALKAPEFKRCRQAVFVLSTSQVVTETTTTPVLPEAKLEKLLQANMDMYFPMDMKEYQLVWQVLGPVEKDNDGKEQTVQLWAMPTAMLTRYYNVANACGLSVAAIDYCGHSIATAAGATFARPGKTKEKKKLSLNMEISFGGRKKEGKYAASRVAKNTEDTGVPDTDLHLSLYKDLLGMTFVQRGQVVTQRFVRCGANPVHQFGELAMMLEYFRSTETGRGSTVRGIVSGSLAEDAELIVELSDTLGIPLSTFAADFEAQWAMCVGAVGTTLDFGMPALNRPGKARREVGSQLWQYGLVLAGGLAVVGVVLMTLSSRINWDSGISRLESTRLTLTIQLQKTSEYKDAYDEYKSMQNSYDALYNNYSEDWETIFHSLRTYNDNLVLVLDELEATLPENASVTSLQIAADGLTVQFACENKEVAAYLIMALRKLQYADLVGISNLSGGGSGPATSYGPTEEPPTEGSYEMTDDTMVIISKLLAENLDQKQLMDLAMTLTPEQFNALEQAYGTQPATSYVSVEAMQAVYNWNAVFDKRAAAFREMLTENPFAMKKFGELIEADLDNGPNYIIWDSIEDVLLKEENSDIFLAYIYGTELDNATAMEYWNRLINGLSENEENLTSSENLIRTDGSMEQWYIYYLEVELGLRQAESFPYLNMEQIISDLLEGSFNTGDPDLDAKLNAMIPDSVWTMLEMLKGSGSDDPQKPDDPSDPTNPDDGPTIDYEGLLNDYLANGTTGDPTYDALIENLVNKYLDTGSTGVGPLDAIIEDKLDELLEDYLSSNTTGSDFIDGRIEDMIDQYLSKGTTGNDVLDAIIRDLMKDLINDYMSKGGTGNDYIDGKISEAVDNFLNNGTTGVDVLDELILDYIESMLIKYKKNGSCGVTDLDSMFMLYELGFLPSTGNAKLDALLAKYLGSSSGGNIGGDIGGSTGGSTDTRIFFTVSLSYNDELKNAELERKGLTYSDKISKVEVAE